MTKATQTTTTMAAGKHWELVNPLHAHSLSFGRFLILQEVLRGLESAGVLAHRKRGIEGPAALGLHREHSCDLDHEWQERAAFLHLRTSSASLRMVLDPVGTLVEALCAGRDREPLWRFAANGHRLLDLITRIEARHRRCLARGK